MLPDSNPRTFDEEQLNSPEKRQENEPSWLNMPNKKALAILTISRLVDFWQMASLQSYMVQQLRSFDASLPPTSLSHQAGILQGSFTLAQIVTAILWGRVADSPFVGRRMVLLTGLIGTGASCIGVAFSRSFLEIVVWRVLGGAVNGTVGVARTMVSESVDKKWHSRAFLLLPVAFNIANIFGPVIGGLLVDPVSTYPYLFNGAYGLGWLEVFPYALPSLLCAVLLFLEAGLVVAFLSETLPTIRKGQILIPQLISMYHGVTSILTERQEYSSVSQNDTSEKRLRPLREGSGPMQTLPFAKIWTSNVLWTLLSVGILDFHMGAFSALWIIFLSTSRIGPNISDTSSVLARRDAIHFSGGLSFSPSLLGSSLAVLGITGLVLQILLYPWANTRFGLMRCFRYSLILFPLAYLLAPYLSLFPSTSSPPHPASGVLVWLGISAVLALQVSARTFALPVSIVLVNNACPHPSALGTIHGVGQSVSSAMRTLGPVAGGYWFRLGLEKGMIGMGWWAVAGISTFGCIASLWVRNGTTDGVLLPCYDEEERPSGT